MFGWKELCMVLPFIIMVQAWCIYHLSCIGGRFYYDGSNMNKKIEDLIKKIWSEFWRNRTKYLGVVYQLTMVAFTSLLLKDTHIWVAFWIASIAIFAILYSSYKACVEMKRAQLTPPVNRSYYLVSRRTFLVLDNQVIPILTIYNVVSHWNTGGVVIDMLSMDVENRDVVVTYVAEMVRLGVGIQSVAQQRDGSNQSVVPGVATQRDVEDQFVAHSPEEAEKDDEETESIVNVNVPEIAIQRNVEDQSAAGQPEVAQKDDEENQSVANDYVTEVVIRRDAEDQSEADPSEVAHRDEEFQSFADANVPNVPEVAVHDYDVESQSVASADPLDAVHRVVAENQSYADADPLEVLQRDDAEHKSYADTPELIHKDDVEN